MKTKQADTLGSVSLLTEQIYVQKFTITYCCALLSFSAFFTPQGFNLKVALIVNILFLLNLCYYKWLLNFGRHLIILSCHLIYFSYDTRII